MSKHGWLHFNKIKDKKFRMKKSYMCRLKQILSDSYFREHV